MPVRPQAVITSSAMSSTSKRSQIRFISRERCRAVDPHAARAQDQGLDDQCGGWRRSAAASGLQGVERRLLASRLGEGQGFDLEQQGLIGAGEAAALAGGHRADRVAMIAMLERDDAVARRAAIQPEAERHLQRDLDAGRSAVGVKHVIEPGGRDLDEPGRQLFGGLMGKIGEDDLVERFRLPADRGLDAGVAMTVGRNPPGGDRVDDTAGRPRRRARRRLPG